MNLSRTTAFAALLGITVCGAPSVSAQAPAAAQAARPIPPKSPDIHPDRTVTFRLMAPNASEVTLNGSWDGATNIKMTKDAAGVWSTTVGPLAAQLWGYWYLVDGVKALDPGNAVGRHDQRHAEQAPRALRVHALRAGRSGG